MSKFIDGGEVKLDFDDVLIVPTTNDMTSRSEANLVRTVVFPISKEVWRGIPIIAANMSTVASFEMAQALSKFEIMTAIHKHYSADKLQDFFNTSSAINYDWYTMGIRDEDLQKFQQIKSVTPLKRVCIDVANGYIDKFLDTIKIVRAQYPNITIMAGSVVTPEQSIRIMQAGADIIRVGIGSGSACSTRLKTGIGYPQLSAVLECGGAIHEIGGLICSDGGCKTPADVAKALSAGADFVMVGGMLAGHDEVSAVRTVDSTGKTYVEFYGMSSERAMLEHDNAMSNYRTSEGKVVQIPSRGPVQATILDMLGGLRSTMTYVGARTLTDLPNKTKFVRVNRTHNTVFNDLN